MTVAITGSEGFIGTHLQKKLASESVDVIRIDFKLGYDLCNWDAVKSIPKFDVLVHFAGKSYVPDSYKDPRQFYEVNIQGTLNALELCRMHSARMVFTSSYVYGQPDYLPIDEKHPLKPFNPYAQSKIIGEQLCESYHRDFNTDVVVVRPFNIFGHGQREDFLIPKIINQALSGKVELFDPKPRRDFIYINDVMDAYYKIIKLDKNTFDVINLGSGVSYPVEEIANTIVNLFPDKISISYNNEQRANEVKDTIADISHAKNLLNWEPKYNLRSGLADYIKKILS
ncbi:MAG: NAD(P)-dependent oxidoreductase [Calditrichaeota bacterium]|nr:NAD(P)-dependent oxidoreductase [Calditrichota bacterium]